jgi:hypothetical protein
MKTQGLHKQAVLDSQTTSLRSDDGAVVFNLARVASGVYVERVQERPGVCHIRQAARFQDEEGFLRWIDCDWLQFAHPLLFSRIKRATHELFHQYAEYGQDAGTSHRSA